MHRKCTNRIFFFVRSKQFKVSTLWAQYFMLKEMLVVESNVDMSKIPKLIAFLKKKNDDYRLKKSKILRTEQIDKFVILTSKE